MSIHRADLAYLITRCKLLTGKGIDDNAAYLFSADRLIKHIIDKLISKENALPIDSFPTDIRFCMKRILKWLNEEGGTVMVNFDGNDFVVGNDEFDDAIEELKQLRSILHKHMVTIC